MDWLWLEKLEGAVDNARVAVSYLPRPRLLFTNSIKVTSQVAFLASSLFACAEMPPSSPPSQAGDVPPAIESPRPDQDVASDVEESQRFLANANDAESGQVPVGLEGKYDITLESILLDNVGVMLNSDLYRMTGALLPLVLWKSKICERSLEPTFYSFVDDSNRELKLWKVKSGVKYRPALAWGSRALVIPSEMTSAGIVRFRLLIQEKGWSKLTSATLVDQDIVILITIKNVEEIQQFGQTTLEVELHRDHPTNISAGKIEFRIRSVPNSESL